MARQPLSSRGTDSTDYEILSAEPHRLLRYRWRDRESGSGDNGAREVDSVVTVELAPGHAGGTHLRLTHGEFRIVSGAQPTSTAGVTPLTRAMRRSSPTGIVCRAPSLTASGMMSANLVPMVVEQSARGERAFDIFSRLLRDRIVFVNGQIDDATVALVNAQLLFLESENPEKPIAMYINSPGGMVTSGLAIYDTMQWIRCPVATVCVGTAYSMGSFLLMAGAPGQRIALPNASILVHQPSGGFQGVASDIERHAQDILKTKRRLNEIYAKHCGRTYEEVERTLDRDHFMTAAEAKEWGLVDHVYSSRTALERRALTA